ncbi:SET domain-containing protein-lysine N-methyltransferase [Salmonella bongori]|uniref:SET domain-containing protein-lysine N-methyltransferase n=1 Tax=Salmonella bongori TaxID=54736 RepID=UPI0009AA748A|nr:SET domain-containing protein-lysine N-methyltransferase [Salmonella bongori]
MRGIGSVIHFHAPAANSTSATHLSEAWNDIRDWFPLTAQDEAARCFRVFYQPEEGTPPPDRLKHFLRLKALASPGRQANFTAERMVSTGETQCAIAAGKSSNFPAVTLLLSDPEWHAAHSQEELPLTVSSDSRTATVTEPGARPKLPSITNAQIQAWHDLTPEAKREAGSWKVWARAQGIAIKNTRNYLTNSGLTPRGVARLMSARKEFSSITSKQLQAWRDLTPEAKREAGSWKVWARAQGIAIRSAVNYLTNSGLTPRGLERLLPAEAKCSSITDNQLRAWRDLTPEAKRESGGWKAWAQAQGISVGRARSFLTNTGLAPRGVARLQPPEGRGASITDDQIQTWRDLTPEAKREAGGWRAWAQAQGISVGSAANFLTNTGLSPGGVARLRPPEVRGTSITSKQIRAWRDMTPEAKREAGGWVAWAQAQGISVGRARSFLTNTGLAYRGVARLQPPGKKDAPITKTQIQTWRDLTPEAKRESGGWKAWAQAQGISVGSARTFLTNTGLAPRGIMRLQQPKKRNAPVTDSPMQTWRDLSTEATREAGDQRTWAQAQGISNERAGQSLPLADSKMSLGSTLFSATVTHHSSQPSTSAGGRGSLTVRADTSLASSGDKRALPLAGEDIPAPPTKQIKKEEDAVTWRTHQIDNNLPILQHWRDPTVSVMEQAEGRKEALQVTLWGSLFNRLPRRIKVRINQDIQWFLQNEGNHDARMNDMMTVSIPLDDSDGYRGRTVYARTDLPAFTVLGPYSGRLLESETVRCEYEKEYGREASNYYFATRSQERIVSAWPQGNLLSLINNPVFGRRTAEAEARQNVSAVLVGKNITFYLTTRDISAGEELWFDYGADYQHFEAGKELRSGQIKEEPPSPESEAV